MKQFQQSEQDAKETHKSQSGEKKVQGKRLKKEKRSSRQVSAQKSNKTKKQEMKFITSKGFSPSKPPSPYFEK